MKRISTAIAIALLTCAATAATASAKVKSHVYSVGQDFIIAGTTVKAGTYRFSFDDEKNELTLIDKKTKEVVARAQARAEKWGKGLKALGVQLTGDASPREFAGLSFDGKLVIRVSSAGAQGK